MLSKPKTMEVFFIKNKNFQNEIFNVVKTQIHGGILYKKIKFPKRNI